MSSESPDISRRKGGNAKIVRDSSTSLRSARNGREQNAAGKLQQEEEETFAQHEMDITVEHFVYCSVEDCECV
jgi:hypothetical protein